MRYGRLGKLRELFLVFFRIGAFTFGGAYAMIPLIQHEVVEKKKWISEDDILEMVAISESTPGPIAINVATFVGYRTAGFWGSFWATMGVVLPSFLVITLLSYVLDRFHEFAPVRYAFFGIRAGVLALILKALWGMYMKCRKKPLSHMIAGIAFVLAAVLKLNVIVVILFCGALGLVVSLWAERRLK